MLQHKLLNAMDCFNMLVIPFSTKKLAQGLSSLTGFNSRIIYLVFYMYKPNTPFRFAGSEG